MLALAISVRSARHPPVKSRGPCFARSLGALNGRRRGRWRPGCLLWGLNSGGIHACQPGARSPRRRKGASAASFVNVNSSTGGVEANGIRRMGPSRQPQLDRWTASRRSLYSIQRQPFQPIIDGLRPLLHGCERHRPFLHGCERHGTVPSMNPAEPRPWFVRPMSWPCSSSH